MAVLLVIEIIWGCNGIDTINTMTMSGLNVKDSVLQEPSEPSDITNIYICTHCIHTYTFFSVHVLFSQSRDKTTKKTRKIIIDQSLWHTLLLVDLPFVAPGNACNATSLMNARIFQAGEIPWILIISDSDSQILIITIIAGKYPQDQWEVSAIIASMGAKHKLFSVCSFPLG